MISVLHCPEQIGNNPVVLSKFEKELGLYSLCVSEKSNPFASSADYLLKDENCTTVGVEIRDYCLFLRLLFRQEFFTLIMADL